jgi:hypothetical protein
MHALSSSTYFSQPGIGSTVPLITQTMEGSLIWSYSNIEILFKIAIRHSVQF